MQMKDDKEYEAAKSADRWAELGWTASLLVVMGAGIASIALGAVGAVLSFVLLAFGMGMLGGYWFPCPTKTAPKVKDPNGEG